MEAGSSELTEPCQGNKMEDTVTLARQEREKQGTWEAEVSYGGEVDLHQHLSSCKKNPGHKNFIPVDQLNVEHLPLGCHDNDLVDMVRAMSALTVRVSVNYVSDSRPVTVPGSDKSFPCYKDRGKDMLRTGTGWVKSVAIYPNKHDNSYTTCKCKECVNCPTPKTQFAHIYIRTAAHIVYDDLEAAHTTCHLFFDKGKSPEDCGGVVTLSGLSFVRHELERDYCYVRYMTHDLDLADRVNKTVKHYKFLSASIDHTSNPLLSDENHLSREQWAQRSSLCHNTSSDRLTIVVSHPHGCSKQVSFGRCTYLERGKDRLTKCTYTAPTCHGSSGAHVCVMGKQGGLGVIDGYVHSWGQGEGNRQLNFSARGHYIV